MKQAVKEAPEQEKEMTQEEIEAHEKRMKEQREELMKFYDEQLPFLKKQAEYEETITRIEVAKMQRLEIMYAKAQMMGGPKGPEEEPEDEHEFHDKPQKSPAEKEGRTLRREK